MDTPAHILTPINITFSIRTAECLSFSFTDYALKNKIAIDSGSFQYDFKVQQTVLPDEKNLSVTFLTTLLEIQGASRIPLADLTSKMIFHIVNFDDVIQTVNNQFQISNALLSLASGISASTVRGMFVIKLQGSIYTNAVMPAVDPNIFIPHRPLSNNLL